MFVVILTGIEKVNRRRNEKSVPPLQSRKAEMTSGVSPSSVGPNQNKPAANPQLPGLLGARPTGSTNADVPLRGSVATQTASRAESTNLLLSPPSRPSTSLPSASSKKVTTTTSARNHSKPPRISTTATATTTSVFAPPRPFHPAVRVLVADNPDLKLQSQGSAVASHGPELVDDGAAAAATAGLDADTSSVCDRDTNYVVFDYPESLNETDHYSQVVVKDEVKEEVKETPHSNVMGTYPDVGYNSEEKSADDGSSADIVRQHLKEDDLLDDFFKFVSNGTY